MCARSPNGTSCLSCTIRVRRTATPSDRRSKDLLKSLEKTMPGVRERIFGAMQRYPLEGWEPDKTRRDYK